MTTDRERLAATFDSAADLYQQARPEYPAELYEALIRSAGLAAGDSLLEIGCATGKATIPLAQRGFRITAIEFGAELAAAARQNLTSFPGVEIVEANFETWQPPTQLPDQPPAGTAFRLVFAATAWHWIDPGLRYQKAWSLLGPGGHLAFWGATHVVPIDGDPFFYEIQDVYEEIGEGLPPDAVWPRPGELPDEREDIVRSGLFEPVTIRQFDWEISYDAESYIRLLDTFSGHIAMTPWQRERLYAEIRRRLAARPDGQLRRHWGAVLHVARRLDHP
jgi:SAM-dependent methyltransferase